ncbi:hypothetical protein JL721_10546 [Aureococcus anophagefferens]|nr:hypothetical protein JL721_10546 [Aureococcus anophagefferens]
MESPRVVGVEAVTVACLDALEMLEKHADDEEPLRQRYPSTGALARALYRALRALHEREAGPLSTLRNVERKVSQLAESLSGGPAAESGSCYVGGALGDDDAELAVADVPSRLFWIERFGRFSSEVPWAQFTASVVDEFGEQPRTLELLKPAPASATPASSSAALAEGLLGVAVAAVCCGGQHAAVLTAAGEVYTWGRGGFGRLGHGDARDSLKAPARPAALPASSARRVREISVGPGGYHTRSLVSPADVYTWGHNRVGQLGYTNNDACGATARARTGAAKR